MAKVEGIKELNVALTKLSVAARESTKGSGRVSVIVGFTANYALWVHENVEMKWQGLPRRKPAKGVYWGPAGQAKFLEQPARMLAPELSKMVVTALRKGSTMAQALLIAGLRLQRESQKLVPIDTGNLKNSAFTRQEK